MRILGLATPLIIAGALVLVLVLYGIPLLILPIVARIAQSRTKGP